MFEYQNGEEIKIKIADNFVILTGTKKARVRGQTLTLNLKNQNPAYSENDAEYEEQLKQLKDSIANTTLIIVLTVVGATLLLMIM